MMKELFDDTVSNLEARLRDNYTARGKYTLEVTRLGQRLYSDSHRVALCGVCAPFDLLNAMGISSCFKRLVVVNCTVYTYVVNVLCTTNS